MTEPSDQHISSNTNYLMDWMSNLYSQSIGTRSNFNIPQMLEDFNLNLLMGFPRTQLTPAEKLNLLELFQRHMLEILTPDSYGRDYQICKMIGISIMYLSFPQSNFYELRMADEGSIEGPPTFGKGYLGTPYNTIVDTENIRFRVDKESNTQFLQQFKSDYIAGLIKLLSTNSKIRNSANNNEDNSSLITQETEYMILDTWKEYIIMEIRTSKSDFIFESLNDEQLKYNETMVKKKFESFIQDPMIGLLNFFMKLPTRFENNTTEVDDNTFADVLQNPTTPTTFKNSLKKFLEETQNILAVVPEVSTKRFNIEGRQDKFRSDSIFSQELERGEPDFIVYFNPTSTPLFTVEVKKKVNSNEFDALIAKMNDPNINPHEVGLFIAEKKETRDLIHECFRYSLEFSVDTCILTDFLASTYVLNFESSYKTYPQSGKELTMVNFNILKFQTDSFINNRTGFGALCVKGLIDLFGREIFSEFDSESSDSNTENGRQFKHILLERFKDLYNPNNDNSGNPSPKDLLNRKMQNIYENAKRQPASIINILQELIDFYEHSQSYDSHESGKLQDTNEETSTKTNVLWLDMSDQSIVEVIPSVIPEIELTKDMIGPGFFEWNKDIIQELIHFTKKLKIKMNVFFDCLGDSINQEVLNTYTHTEMSSRYVYLKCYDYMIIESMLLDSIREIYNDCDDYDGDLNTEIADFRKRATKIINEEIRKAYNNYDKINNFNNEVIRGSSSGSATTDSGDKIPTSAITSLSSDIIGISDIIYSGNLVMMNKASNSYSCAGKCIVYEMIGEPISSTSDDSEEFMEKLNNFSEILSLVNYQTDPDNINYIKQNTEDGTSLTEFCIGDLGILTNINEAVC